ncbi:MAG: hypothetical protein HYU59_04880 [Magnetospirillum gryphiswaldense]|nr:hypothetical protein [Magnetospirillum gryphiswaldense]
MIKKGDVIFKGCTAKEDFCSGAGGSSGMAVYMGDIVHVKIPDSPKCPIGEAAKAKGAKERIAVFKGLVAAWEKRIAAFERCTIQDYMIQTTKLVVFDASPRVRQLALVSPFIEGLEKTTDVVASLDETGKRQFAVTAIAQLRSIHTDGRIVHSDIKPPNTMVYRAGGTVQARVLDFDASYPIGEVPKPENYVGDLYYFAPEVSGYFRTGSPEKIGPKVDVFSLGLMLAELFAGERMPGLDVKAGLTYPADVLAAGAVDVAAWLKGRGVADDLAGVLAAMLNPVPEKRITSAEADDLMASRHRLDLAEPPVAPEERARIEPKPDPVSFKGMKMPGGAPSAPLSGEPKPEPVFTFKGMKKPEMAPHVAATMFPAMKGGGKSIGVVPTEPAFAGMNGLSGAAPEAPVTPEGGGRVIAFPAMKVRKDRI